MGFLDSFTGRTNKKLLAAAGHGDVQTLRSLLAQGISPEVTDDEWMTPLHWAARRGRSEAARIPVDAGADINIKDKELYSPLQWACFAGNFEVAKLLLDRGAEFESGDVVEINPLIQAAGGSPRLGEGVNIVALLVERGADIHACDSSGATALFHATRRGFLETAKYLIDKGADIQHRDGNGWTVLHHAAFYGRAELLEYFLDEGGLDAETVTWFSERRATPAQLAAERSHDHILDILESRGVIRRGPS
jgi:ankyrin repeat protein